MCLMDFRWNQTPLSEAVRFGHPHIASYLRMFIKNNPNQGWDASAQAYENDFQDDGASDKGLFELNTLSRKS